MIKVNSPESIKGSVYSVTINEIGYEGTLVEGQSFWEDPMGAGLTIYLISDTNEIVVDKKGDCPAIQSVKLKIEGVDVPIILKS